MLTKTQLKILAYLIDNQEEFVGIRELSNRISTVYYLVSRNVHQLEQKNIIFFKTAGRTKVILLHLNADISIMIEAESYKKKNFFNKYPDIRLLLQTIIETSKSAFFCLSVFGSYTHKPRKDSDLDMLIIVQDKRQIDSLEKEIATIARTTHIKMHSIIIAENTFKSMLNEKGMNVAKEMQSKHILIYGGESFYKMIRW